MTAQQRKAAAIPRPQATDDSTAESKAAEALFHGSLTQMTAQKSREAATPSPQATDDSTAEQRGSYNQGLKPQMTAQQSKEAAILQSQAMQPQFKAE